MQKQTSKKIPVFFTVLFLSLQTFAGLEFLLPVQEAKADGKTYYVANDGNDSCNGKSSANGSSGTGAWKTISKVNTSSFSAGDSILFNRGDIWREQLTVPSSGSAGSPITFGAYGNSGANPIISGADVISSWSLTAIPGAHAPTPSAITDSTIYESILTWTPSKVFESGEFITYVTWDTNIPKTAPSMIAGTWTFDPAAKKLYVYASDGANPASHAIEATRREVIDGSGKDWINIAGITLVQSKYAGLDSDGGDNWNIRNVTAHHNSDYGIKASGGSQNITVEDSTAYRNQYRIGANVATNVTVRRCTSHDNNFIMDSDGMQFNTVTGLLVEYCDIYRNNNGTSADNLQINHTTSATVRYNHFHGGANSNIIFSGKNSYGDVCGNLIEDGQNGVNIHGATQKFPINVYNNTLYHVAQRPLRVYATDASTITMKNNIVWGTTHTVVVEPGVAVSKITLDHNIYHNNSGNSYSWNGTDYATLSAYQSASNQDANSLASDPLFTDAAGSDFSLRSTSPAIDSGTNLGSTYNNAILPGSIWPSSITTADQNLRGSGWEIGAYVF